MADKMFTTWDGMDIHAKVADRANADADGNSLTLGLDASGKVASIGGKEISSTGGSMYDLGTKTENDLNNGKLAIGCGNSNTELALTTANALTVLANSGVANFVLLVDNSGNSNDVTVTVKDSTDTTTFYQSTASGNTVSVGKICQITCVGRCWTLAEFEAPA